MSEVKIEKIILAVGKKEITLSLQEAKELQDILNKTFGEDKISYIPYSPIIIEKRTYPPYITWTCKSSNNSSNTLLFSTKQGD